MVSIVRGSAPGSPGTRPCCLLIEELPFPAGSNIFDPAKPSNYEHTYGAGAGNFISSTVGIVYTCRGGFIDLGHLRDVADLTRYYNHLVSSNLKKGSSFPTIHYSGGMVTIKNDIPIMSALAVAMCIAYDQATFHEIYSYWVNDLGMHMSAFSPEDCVSNFLGAHVAKKAIDQGGDFDKAIAKEIEALLNALGKLPVSGTKNAFSKIRGRWFTGVIEVFTRNYVLRRRNFDVEPINPWLVSGVLGCTDTSFPSTISRTMPVGMRSNYEVSFPIPPPSQAGMGSLKSIKNNEFSAQIARIKTNASSRYGVGFDSPN